MHFYTYDEWLANSYYSIDSSEISKGSTQIYQLKDHDYYLHIRSCWKDPKFVSTMGSDASVTPELSKIDLDVGCLYKMKPTSEPETQEEYRKNRGCIQELGGNFGDPRDTYVNTFPYIKILGAYVGSDVEPIVYEDKFSGQHKTVMVVNLRQFSKFEKILVFQSIYSGAVSFEEANSSLELLFTNLSTVPNTIYSGGPSVQDYNYLIKTNLYSGDSLMLAALLLSFSSVGSKNFLTIQNLSQFVYGHNDMSNQFDWTVLWKCFEPQGPWMESSIMHQEKQ